MKQLIDYKEEIHSCSKCGLCQSVCPIYKITGNDCTVSRGHFIMLKGLIKGDLRMSKTINKYLGLCLKCGACSKFCPSGIDVVDIVSLAKAEYFKSHFVEKVVSFIQKKILLGIFLRVIGLFSKNRKSKNYDKKVVYFGGCGAKIYGNSKIVKILNSVGVEVVSPDFDCCGMPFFVRGDFDSFNEYMNNFYEKIDKYKDFDILVTCASCEKVLKSYEKWSGRAGLKITNLFEYMKENNIELELKKKKDVTFHKPCNMDNYDDVKQVMEKIKNLNYKEMDDYDMCCGLNGVTNFAEYCTVMPLFIKKHNAIKKSGIKTVLTSCLGCKIILNLFSFGKYKVEDFTDFLYKNIK